MLLMIDNYDSFTYNLVQYLGELGAEVKVVRNDALSLDEIAALKPNYIVISPGPRTPADAGISVPIIERFQGHVPILGVCLGHQSIGHALGGKIVHAKEIMHGKISAVYHNNQSVFRGLPSPFQATRYHSLVIDASCVPDCLEVTAWTQDAAGGLNEIMGVQHKSVNLQGVQFHPESIFTEHGHAMLKNFLESRI